MVEEHLDFVNTNDIWTWVDPDPDKGFEFKKVELNTAVAGE